MSIHSRSGSAAWENWVILPTPSMEVRARLRGLRLPYAEVYWKEGRNTFPGLICHAGHFVKCHAEADMVLLVGTPDNRGRSAAYLIYHTGTVVPLGRLMDVGDSATQAAPRSWYTYGHHFIAVPTDRPTCYANERWSKEVMEVITSPAPSRHLQAV